MSETHLRLSGTLRRGEEFYNNTEEMSVSGITGVYEEEFEAVVQFEGTDDACDALLHVLNDDREELLSSVLSQETIENIAGSGEIDASSVMVEATVSDSDLAYVLATRVAGQHEGEAEILGQAATSVEGILLDFAMERRGSRIDGLSPAARNALLTHVIEQRSKGNEDFEVEELETTA